MTKEEKQNKFLVEQAFKQGKKIQFKPKDSKEWISFPDDVKYIIWDWKFKDYRVQPS